MANSDAAGIWKDVGQYIRQETDNYRQPLRKQSVSGPTLESDTSRVPVKSTSFHVQLR